MSDALRQKVRGFIAQRFPTFVAKKLGDSDSLLDSGVIDSLGILDLATYLESELKVQLGDDEMLPENFDSVDSITTFLARKVAS